MSTDSCWLISFQLQYAKTGVHLCGSRPVQIGIVQVLNNLEEIKKNLKGWFYCISCFALLTLQWKETPFPVLFCVFLYRLYPSPFILRML